jgi:hypothetical protein
MRAENMRRTRIRRGTATYSATVGVPRHIRNRSHVGFPSATRPVRLASSASTRAAARATACRSFGDGDQ